MFGSKDDKAPSIAETSNWVVPEKCPNCGAIVDQAVQSVAADPRCGYCHEPLPVQRQGSSAVVGDISSTVQRIERHNAEFRDMMAALQAAKGNPAEIERLKAEIQRRRDNPT